MIKYLTYLILGSVFWIHSSARADVDTSLELIGGGLTYHLIDNGGSVKNVNKLSGDGRLIDNPLLGVGIEIEVYHFLYQTFIGFSGANSVGKPIGGGLYEIGLVLNSFQIGLTAGAYVQNDVAFRDSGEEPFRLFEIGQYGLVPIVGLNVNYKLKLSNSVYLKLNNIITPILTNTTVSVGLKL